MSSHDKQDDQNQSGQPSPAQILSQKWNSGQQVDLTQFLEGFAQLPTNELISVVLVDQYERWKIGNFVLAEEYFNRFSWIKTDRSAAVDLIYREYLLREQGKQLQTDQEFLQRFPEFSQELALQLQVHRLVDSREFANQADTHAGIHPRSAVGTLGDESRQTAWQRAVSQSINQQFPVITGYQLIELIGQGGMGAVYLGWHQKLNRKVAVKVVRSTMWSDASSRDRFEAEARATARLNHPNIVQIYEVGEIDNQLFFSLEYCRGGSLSEWLGGTPLPARQAAQVNLPICLAVHHAHQRGVIHRDLKPANIVLQLSDDKQVERIGANLDLATPKVTDFGLARNNDEIGKTRADALVGTPSYMSPEQARGATEVTQLSDVYSLGAILYEMLTGRPPFKGASVMETVRQVINDEPVAPMRFHPNMPRDLQTICLKALQKEPAKRYASALEFAEDLRRFLDRVPIKARPVSGTERAYRWARRNPGWTTALAALVVMLAVAWQLTMINVSQTRASLRELKEEQARTLEEQKRAEQALEKAEKGLYLANISQANAAWNSLSMSSMKTFLDQCPTKLRSWEWNYLSNLNDRRNEVWRDESSPITSIAWDPFNEQIATANLNGQICIYNTTEPTPLSVRQLEPLYRQKLAFLNRGEKLLFVQAVKAQMIVGSRGIQVGMIDQSDPQATPFTWAPDKPYGISDLSVGGERKRFAIALLNKEKPSLPGVIKLFSSDSFPPTEVATLDMPTAGCRFISLSPDGKQIAVGGGDRLIYLIDTFDNTVLDRLEALNDEPPNPSATGGIADAFLFGKKYTHIEWGVDRVQYSPDGKYLAAGAYHGVVKIWDMTTKQLLFVLQSEDDHLTHVLFSQDNKRLAVLPANSAVIHQYDLQTGREFAAHQGHFDSVSGLVFDNEGNMLTSGIDGSIRRWGGSDQSNNRVLVGHRQTVLGAAFHPNGKILATGEGNIVKATSPSKIRFWNLETRQCQRQLDVNYSVGTMRYDKSGDRLAVAGGDGVVRVFSDSMESPTLLKGHSYSITSLDWSPKDDELVSTSGSLLLAMLPGEAIIWDTKTMQKRLKLVGHSSALSSVAYSPDGGTIVTGSADKTVKIWESKTGKCIKTLSGPEDPVISLVYDPNGRWIAAGSGDIWNPLFPKPGAIHIWNTTTWELERVLLGHSQLVHGLSVTSDGSRLISCARNDKIRLWEPETGIELLTMSPSDYACGVCFSPNGKYLAVPNWSGKIDLFSANSAVESISSTERQ